MKSFLNIGAIPKCTTYAHFALLMENSFAIKESGNIILKSLFVARHNLYEKWFSDTFKDSSAITLGNLTDNVGELVQGDLSLTGSLTAF